MRVVAFLQNCWFEPGTPQHIIYKYLQDPTYRRKVLALTMSGKRLTRAFGSYYDEIHWDNASINVGTAAHMKFDADTEHMMGVIGEHSPVCIIAFGRVAFGGLQQIATRYGAKANWHYCPHPNARGPTQNDFNNFASEIIVRYFK